MSNAESELRSRPRRPDSDPVSSIIVAMRDACLAGVAALERVSGPLANISSPEMAARDAGASGTAGAADHWAGTEPGQERRGAADLALPISQAMGIAASRSVSYWLGLARILATHQARSVGATDAAVIEGSGPESQRIVAAEQLRTLLREVGDLATQEARLLQNELGDLGENLARTLQQPDRSAPYRRRWRTKV